mmetsp:Transcript_86797/g.232644  ORF Transcript_86797/g.232644 Transcript_86797/m.232644 type:complete len:595 (+) Transcript_86797:206-1990(+)
MSNSEAVPLPSAETVSALEVSCLEGGAKPDQFPEIESTCIKVMRLLNEIVARAQLPFQLRVFGSFSNGFKTSSSDLDVCLVGDMHIPPTVVLAQIAQEAPAERFFSVTKVFKAKVPLLKVTHETGIEVDLCVNNRLGLRNSALLLLYCRLDKRVAQVGRLVKAWSKHAEIVGTADGCLNSYAFILITVHYLLHVGVVPNLQLAAKEPVLIEGWDTKFLDPEEIDKISPSSNQETVSQLILGFLRYFGWEFDWQNLAVSIGRKQAGTQGDVPKSTMPMISGTDQWYVEDPFDLRHNLAGMCSPAGKARVIGALRTAYTNLCHTGDWLRSITFVAHSGYWLKCRVSVQVSPRQLLDLFDDNQTFCEELYFPREPNRAMCFIRFATRAYQRTAHSLNESYVTDVQLFLHVSAKSALDDIAESPITYLVFNRKQTERQRMGLRSQHAPYLTAPESLMELESTEYTPSSSAPKAVFTEVVNLDSERIPSPVVSGVLPGKSHVSRGEQVHRRSPPPKPLLLWQSSNPPPLLPADRNFSGFPVRTTIVTGRGELSDVAWVSTKVVPCDDLFQHSGLPAQTVQKLFQVRGGLARMQAQAAWA